MKIQYVFNILFHLSDMIAYVREDIVEQFVKNVCIIIYAIRFFLFLIQIFLIQKSIISNYVIFSLKLSHSLIRNSESVIL